MQTTTNRGYKKPSYEDQADIAIIGANFDMVDKDVKDLIDNKAPSQHEHAAVQVKFTDGKTFQQKLDEGSLRGQQGIQGLKGATGAKGDKGEKGDASSGGGGGQSVYDLVIKTQLDFAAMSELSGVKSICILDGKYTFERTFYIPSDVISITGIGNVELEFSNLPVKQLNYCFNCERSCSISNINIKVNTNYEGTYCCFKGFSNVINCSADFDCNVDKMIPEGYRNEMSGIGFQGCSNLTNCKFYGYTQGDLNGDVSGDIVSYLSCTNLINCKADIGSSAFVGGNGLPAFNFKDCQCLVNCSGAAESRTSEAYIFYNCDFLNNCHPSTMIGIFLGGVNTHVDTLTVAEY